MERTESMQQRTESCNKVQSISGPGQLKPAALGPVVLRKTASKRSKAFRIVWTSKSRGPGNCTEILGLQVFSGECHCEAKIGTVWFQPDWIGSSSWSSCELLADIISSWSFVITCWSVWNRHASDNSIQFLRHISRIILLWDHFPGSFSSSSRFQPWFQPNRVYPPVI